MYCYSSHNTKYDAYAALEEYYATGEVYPCEFAEIRRVRGRWHIMLRGV